MGKIDVEIFLENVASLASSEMNEHLLHVWRRKRV